MSCNRKRSTRRSHTSSIESLHYTSPISRQRVRQRNSSDCLKYLSGVKSLGTSMYKFYQNSHACSGRKEFFLTSVCRSKLAKLIITTGVAQTLKEAHTALDALKTTMWSCEGRLSMANLKESSYRPIIVKSIGQ